MRAEKNALQWVEYAEAHWWNPDDLFPKIQLDEHVVDILEVLHKAEQSGDHARVWQEIDRVRAKYITMQRFDAGVALHNCALAALRLKNIKAARELLYDARDNLSRGDSHHYALATWMLGCVYWLEENSQQNKGIDAWQETINIFERQANNASTNTEKMRWYRRRLAEMVNLMEVAIQDERLPAIRDILGDVSIGASVAFSADYVKEEAPEPAQKLEFPIKIENFFELFAVYEEIPAGLPGPVAFNPTSTNPAGYDSISTGETLEVIQVRIGDAEYRMQSLVAGDNRVNLIRDEKHYVLRVRGESMNKAGIDNGNLIVIRAQMTAENGDIVAAEIVGVDFSRATLKRYSRRGKVITLQAESSSKEFAGKEWDFTPDSENKEDGFYIRGVAVAVLKPV